MSSVVLNLVSFADASACLNRSAEVEHEVADTHLPLQRKANRRLRLAEKSPSLDLARRPGNEIFYLLGLGLKLAESLAGGRIGRPAE